MPVESTDHIVHLKETHQQLHGACLQVVHLQPRFQDFAVQDRLQVRQCIFHLVVQILTVGSPRPPEFTNKNRWYY
jgi:hypothetical protein